MLLQRKPPVTRSQTELGPGGRADYSDADLCDSRQWIVRESTGLYTYLMLTISASRARQTLPEQLTRAESGEEVAITRHGRVVAVLVSPTTLKRRRAARAFDRAQQIEDRLAAARLQPLNAQAMGSGRAEELVATVEESRSTR